MHFASVGHTVFAATLIALGVQGLVIGDFTVPWQPVSEGVTGREALAYLCGFVSLASGAGLLWRRSAAHASRVLLAWLLIWFARFRLPEVYRAPTASVTWEGAAETVAIVAGAWALYACLAAGQDGKGRGVGTGEKGLHIARVLYGLAMIAFGQAHFAYVKYTAALVPPWLPWHAAWVYLTGATYIAAGVAMLIGFWARLAAALSAMQMGLFLLLVWVPMLAAGHRGASEWSETLVSWALTAAGWVVADSYRGMPWLAVDKRWASTRAGA